MTVSDSREGRKKFATTAEPRKSLVFVSSFLVAAGETTKKQGTTIFFHNGLLFCVFPVKWKLTPCYYRAVASPFSLQKLQGARHGEKDQLCSLKKTLKIRPDRTQAGRSWDTHTYLIITIRIQLLLANFPHFLQIGTTHIRAELLKLVEIRRYFVVNIISRLTIFRKKYR
jgi:hypothetical protein